MSTASSCRAKRLPRGEAYRLFPPNLHLPYMAAAATMFLLRGWVFLWSVDLKFSVRMSHIRIQMTPAHYGNQCNLFSKRIRQTFCLAEVWLVASISSKIDSNSSVLSLTPLDHRLTRPLSIFALAAFGFLKSSFAFEDFLCCSLGGSALGSCCVRCGWDASGWLGFGKFWPTWK